MKSAKFALCQSHSAAVNTYGSTQSHLETTQYNHACLLTTDKLSRKKCSLLCPNAFQRQKLKLISLFSFLTHSNPISHTLIFTVNYNNHTSNFAGSSMKLLTVPPHPNSQAVYASSKLFTAVECMYVCNLPVIGLPHECHDPSVSKRKLLVT